MYGFQDSEEVSAGGGGGKFGLNTKVFVTKFEHNPNAGKDGAQQDAIDFTVQIGEREYRKRFFPVGKVYAQKGGGELTDTTTDEYKQQHKAAIGLLTGSLTDIVKVFVEEETVKTALAAPQTSFSDYAQILQRLVQGTPNWNKTPVDVFLVYQWVIKGDSDKTYLELPKDVKHGKFISKAQTGVFKLDENSTGIKYVNEAGDIHPLSRNAWFAGSAFSKQTTLNPQAATTMESAATGASGW